MSKVIELVSGPKSSGLQFSIPPLMICVPSARQSWLLTTRVEAVLLDVNDVGVVKINILSEG